MGLPEKLVDYPHLSKYLQVDNARVRNAVGKLAATVHASANQANQGIQRNRQSISDAADYLDGVLMTELAFSQAEELLAIAAIEKELSSFFEQVVLDQAFSGLGQEMESQRQSLAGREEELRRKEEELDRIISIRVAEAEAKVKREITTSRGLLESASTKTDNIFEQNKITRFACATISRFQEEFVKLQDSRDVEQATRLFQETVEPFQTTRMTTNKEGKLVKVVVSSFCDACYQDLFFFFYKYYNELIEMYEKEQKLPGIADELARIFSKKPKGAEEIIAEIFNRKKLGREGAGHPK